jgi:sulfur carrier protein
MSGIPVRQAENPSTPTGTAMQIVVNGENTAVAEAISLSDLVDSLLLAGQRLAIELNGAIVPRSLWPEVRLSEGDRAEIVRAIGGG